MKHLLLAVALFGTLGACKKERVAECDAFLVTADKLAACSAFPESSRAQLKAGADSMRTALKQIDDAGGIGSAPQKLADQLRNACKSQDEMAKKNAPADCLK